MPPSDENTYLLAPCFARRVFRDGTRELNECGVLVIDISADCETLYALQDFQFGDYSSQNY